MHITLEHKLYTLHLSVNEITSYNIVMVPNRYIQYELDDIVFQKHLMVTRVASVIKCMVLLRETLNLYLLMLSIYWVLVRIYLLCNKITDIYKVEFGNQEKSNHAFAIFSQESLIREIFYKYLKMYCNIKYIKRILD